MPKETYQRRHDQSRQCLLVREEYKPCPVLGLRGLWRWGAGEERRKTNQTIGAMEVMARPQKEGMDYFPHDVYASSDEKIEPLLLLYGAAGYAFYFLHLEYIYRSGEFEFDVSAAETRQILSTKLGLCQDEYEKILHTVLKYDCFDKNHYEKTGCLTSEGVKKRAQTVIDKRNRMRQMREIKAEKITAAQTEPQMQHKPSKVKERKGKESKEKERKDIKDIMCKKRFSPPSIEEVTAYCQERGNAVDPQKWMNHYISNGWKVGRNQMKDWQAAVRTWEGNGGGKTTFHQRQKTETPFNEKDYGKSGLL